MRIILNWLWGDITGGVFVAKGSRAMIDWPVVIGGYLAIGSLAIYVQYKANIAALDRLVAAHKQNLGDLHLMIEILQMSLLHEQEVKTARLNRVTHADFMEGAVE
jgi:hypothetical protein